MISVIDIQLAKSEVLDYGIITSAPVILNGTRGNMAIAVSITNHNYYKMHRIVMPDGSQFIFKNEKNRAEPSGATSKVDAVTSTTDSVSTNSITNSSKNVKKSLRDSDYLKAVRNGDMETAQKMVDEVAKEAGYTIKAYHGTDAKFTVFDSSKKRTKVLNFGKGFYFGTNKDKAKMYSETGNIIDAYLSMKKPYEIFSYRLDKFDLDRLSNEFSEKVTIDNIQEVLKKNGYDGIIARSYNGTTNPISQYVVFNPNQIKSAEPVVYDDDGNVIPLSKRFDESQDDIRFSIRNTQNMSWEKQINSLLQGKKTIKHSDTLVLNNNTPKYLVENGVENLPLAVPISVITKARSGKDESHSISDINLVNLKNAIENPIAVIENNERNAFVFVTNLKENGKYIIIGFEKSTLFDGDKVHKATSIHSRQNIDLYLKKINNSNIFVENENKLIEMFQGVQNDIERLKQNNKFTKIKISQKNEFVKDFSLRDLTPAQKVARRILKDYNSKADLSEVSDALSKIYTNGVSNSKSATEKHGNGFDSHKKQKRYS